MSNRFHIMRQLRIVLKSGYMKKEPATYTHMKRYPPLTRNTQVPYHKPKAIRVPYMHLYQKVLNRNPIYVDEAVYGAYWMYEPQALTLAKKQYDYMQEGMDEEDAYQKACGYVEELENEAWLEMKKVYASLEKEGIQSSYVSESDVAQELKEWHQKIESIGLNHLDKTEWGELTYFIHDKILKWNEVDRERRMKDIVFVEKFEEMIQLLFGKQSDFNDPNKYSRLKKHILEKFSFDNTVLKPFFVEDYLHYFAKVREEPDIRKWNLVERQQFNEWVVNTLTYRNVVDVNKMEAMEKYLKMTRSLFFPMIIFPQQAKEFQVPTVEQIKKLMFENAIGYKINTAADDAKLKTKNTKNENSQEDIGKLYVKRFYKLPRLLFPEAVDQIEKFVAEAEEIEAARAKEKQEKVAANKKAMQNDELDETNDENDEEMAKDDDEISYAIEKLKSVEEEDFSKPFKRIPDTARTADTGKDAKGKAAKPKSRLDELMKSSLDIDDDVDEDSVEGLAKEAKSLYADEIDHYVPPTPAKYFEVIEDDEKWRRTYGKYYRYPVYELEKVRERHWRSMESDLPEIAQNESEMKLFYNSRMQNVVVSRTRLASKYNEREMARRQADWKRRGMWIDRLKPKASVYDLPRN